MQQNQIIVTLERYKRELDEILSRFNKDRDGIHNRPNDDARFREIALELRDLFDDTFVDGRRHSEPLTAYFNDSISNYIGSPSYQGVENVRGVVTAALARVQRNSLALKNAAMEARARGDRKTRNSVVTLAERLHTVVRQLRERREGRPTLDVNDEYDVQAPISIRSPSHLFRRYPQGLEWAPTYAGGASRMDFPFARDRSGS